MLAYHSLSRKTWQRPKPARWTAQGGAQRALLRIGFDQVQRRTFTPFTITVRHTTAGLAS